MDLLYQFLTIIAGLLALLVFNHLWISTKGSQNKAEEAQEAPGAWPLIGHLLQLSTPQPLYRTLAAMADKHGPAFIVRFGVHRTLVVSNWELAKECLTTNDKALASRPKSAFGDHLSYDYAMIGFAPYGSYWREMRKLVLQKLLSKSMLESQKHIRYLEIDNCIKDLNGLWVKNRGNQVKIEMNSLFCDLIMNVVLKMVVGKRYFSVVEVDAEYSQEVQNIRRTIVEFFRLSGVSVASDAIPFLGWTGFKGEERAMKRTAKEMDVITEKWLQEHQQKRLFAKNGDDDDHEQDFMDVMLSIFEEDSEFHGQPRDTAVKATAMAILLAATNTTAITLTWALSLLLNNKQVLKKAQEELDRHVGKDRNVGEEDIGNLVYLNAVVKEVLRLYPVAPLMIPHEAIEDCNVGGFKIVAGTRVIVNVWRIHRDPNIWSNPLEFQPERFLTSHADVDVWGMNFELIPFGSGRRSCPGISFALSTLHMMLARLLHGFEMQTPFEEHVDMTEAIGLTMPKETPLEVLLTPRLSSHLYE